MGWCSAFAEGKLLYGGWLFRVVVLLMNCFHFLTVILENVSLNLS